MAPAYEARVEWAKGRMESLGVDCALITNLPNVRYLSGFSGTSGSILFIGGESFFLTDFRYTSQAEKEAPNHKIVEYKEFNDSLSNLLLANGCARMGFETERMTHHKAMELESKLDFIKMVPLKGFIEERRLVKDEPEIEAMAALNDLQADVFPKALALIKPGALERDIAVEIEYMLRKGGADGPAFDFIVASGERSALPHGVASGKTLDDGDLVTLDWGAKKWGYHSDNTRTVALGETDKELAKVYSIVLEANKSAIEFVRPGVTVKQVDDVARRIITKAGYGDFFGHGTGHGVGLDIHEKPTVSWREETVVQPGMVFTIEPGIYLPGRGGVRIEDMVAVTESGCDVLSERIPKEFMRV
ncbi:MAG: aminopeptidase P family protein [Nitrospinae bacterium]|nr:aminopeptidase P family protein [Nitrospinota bacterium]